MLGEVGIYRLSVGDFVCFMLGFYLGEGLVVFCKGWIFRVAVVVLFIGRF